jgi:cytochrome c oxidase subunit 2
MNQPPAGSRRPSNSTIIAGILIGILTTVTIIGGLTVLQPHDPITEQGTRTWYLYQATMWISLFVFLLVSNGIIWAMFRYRRKDDTIPEQIHGSNVLEFTWTAIPILILVGLFVPSTILVLDLKTPPDADDTYLTVEAVGHQWWWEFIYPDGTHVQQTPPNYDDLDPPHLVVPTDKTVVVKVRSTDVVHSFYAPNTLFKIQAIPGTVNQMHFKVEDEGVYYGQCYQFCGVRHSDMLFVLDARSETDYLEWLKSQPKSPAPGASSEQAPSLQPVSSTEGQ